MLFSLLKRRSAEPPRALVVGLGNPGAEYRNTRHNVGFRVVDALAGEYRVDMRRLEKRAFVGCGRVDETPVALAKPQTFMNLSGESVAPLARMFELQPDQVIVVTDDINLPLGRLRIRPSGSAGGHNGLKSLIQHLRTEEFPRVRIGVGRPGQGREVIDHVLSKFQRHELEAIEDAVNRAAEAVAVLLREGIEPAMSRFNARDAT